MALLLAMATMMDNCGCIVMCRCGLNDVGVVVGQVRGLDFPLLRLEVIGAVTNVFHKTERLMAVGYDDETRRNAAV